MLGKFHLIFCRAVAEDVGRDAGGAEVQYQNAVVVDLGVVKADGRRKLDAAFDEDAVAANRTAAAVIRVIAAVIQSVKWSGNRPKTRRASPTARKSLFLRLFDLLDELCRVVAGH